MKKLVILISSLFFAAQLQAQQLEAKPFKEVVEAIQTTSFKFTEVGMAFGFETIKSCIYTSEQMIVIKNYCFPKREYPAKGYTIISPKFGLIELYQENLADVLKRDIRLDAFPEIMRDYINGPLSQMKLVEINKVLEKIYYRFAPACWSTNFSQNTEGPEASCNGGTDINNFKPWADETQAVLLNEKAWLELVEQLETQFKD
jgi:hypothetical protein